MNSKIAARAPSRVAGIVPLKSSVLSIDPEALGYGVIPAVALAAHAALNAMPFEQSSHRLARVLNTPIGVPDETLGHASAPDRRFEGEEHEARVHRRVHSTSR